VFAGERANRPNAMDWLAVTEKQMSSLKNSSRPCHGRSRCTKCVAPGIVRQAVLSAMRPLASLHLIGQPHPGITAFIVVRAGRGRKGRVPESTDGNRDDLR